jgi:GTP diphosphokinase / guanosine-3',5'-bis(diphosphate) 3'-diphosphatase
LELQDIIQSFESYSPTKGAELIRRAHTFALENHKGQTRASGEPYITHLREVALLATKLKLDEPSIATALIHDTVEDTEVTLDQITASFGKEIADLVDGVTKLSQIKFTSREEAQAENFRKMLLAMAKDIRILLLKLCDRTHNMRTLEFLSESRRERIARETLDIYAPLAHRLGIYWMKSELEDLCLRYTSPHAFESIKKKVAASKKEREAYIKEVVTLLNNELSENKIEGKVSGRPKHFYSIYQKMERNNLEFDDIYDLIAFRILTSSTMDCYAALGVVHAGWKPVPGRFKDYIAMPKPNGYQSLHTTVIGPRAHRIEIQIRTYEMHEIAERGIAAHWAYKESREDSVPDKKKQLELAWLRDLVESERDIKDPHEFLSTVKDDLFPEEVFVFSPKGDLLSLPRNATPIDFAYYVHSDIGHHCTGARINGQHVPLSYRLRNGDTVEVITSSTQSPSKDWLQLVITTKAKQRIRSHIRSEERKRSIAVGKEALSKDLRKIKKSIHTVQKDGSLEKVAQELGLKDTDSLFADIGYGKLTSKSVTGKLAPEITNLEEQLGKEDSMLQKIFQKAARALRETSGVTVQGMDDMVFRFAKCCQPIPGENVIGFISRGRGVIVHSRTCSQIHSVDPNRLVDVSWDKNIKTLRSITLQILCKDKLGVLAGLTQMISSHGANISSAHAVQKPNGQSLCTFQVHVENTTQLQNLIRGLEGVEGVIKVNRESGHTSL